MRTSTNAPSRMPTTTSNQDQHRKVSSKGRSPSPGCWFLTCWKSPSGSRRLIEQQQLLCDTCIATIEVYPLQKTGNRTVRILKAWLDTGNAESLLSRRCYTDTLELAVDQLSPEASEKPVAQFTRVDGREMQHIGQVDLPWCFPDSDEIYTSRFVVVDHDGPNFDVVLGSDAIRPFHKSAKRLVQRNKSMVSEATCQRAGTSSGEKRASKESSQHWAGGTRV